MGFFVCLVFFSPKTRIRAHSLFDASIIVSHQQIHRTAVNSALMWSEKKKTKKKKQEDDRKKRKTSNPTHKRKKSRGSTLVRFSATRVLMTRFPRAFQSKVLHLPNSLSFIFFFLSFPAAGALMEDENSTGAVFCPC